MIYEKHALRERRILFDVTAQPDPFYSEVNRQQLRKADEQVRDGRVVVKSMEELEAMARE